MTASNITTPSLSSKVDPEVKRAIQTLIMHLKQVAEETAAISSGLTTEVVATVDEETLNQAIQESMNEANLFAPDYTIPSAPTGLTATGGFNQIMLEWVASPGDYIGHYEIFRNTVDDQGTAVKIGTTSALKYVDTPPDSSMSTTYFYWVRAINRWDASIIGPFNATAGTSAATADEPTYVLELLQGELSESHLASTLNTRIDNIDAPGTGLIDSLAQEVTDREAAVNNEASTRQSADNAIAEDVTTLQSVVEDPATGLAAAHSAVQDEATTRANADSAEASAREALAVRVTAAEGGISDNEAAITTEQSARADADSAMAGDISLLEATVEDPDTGLAAAHTAVQTEATARANADGTLEAEHTIKVNANGHIAGMGVAVSGGASGPIESEIIMLADKFAIVKPTASEGEPLTIPFMVGTVDGSPAVIISEALIGDLTVSRAAIKDLAVDDAKVANISGGKITANSITASKYNELRNSLIFNGWDSLDASYPFEVPFLLLSELTAIQSVRLSFKIMPYRAYSTTTLSGGSSVQSTTEEPVPTHDHTLKIVGNSYSAGYTLMYGNQDGKLYLYKSGGATSGYYDFTLETSDGHNHEIRAYYTDSYVGKSYVNYYADSNTLRCSGAKVTTTEVNGHTHVFSLDGAYSGTNAQVYLYGSSLVSAVASGTNYVNPTSESPSAHTHDVTIPNHTHGIDFGIYEESNSPSITVNTDNGAGYGTPLWYSGDQLNIDLTSRFSGAGWKKLKFTASARCRIAFVLECKLDISA
jgi:hypothetical protein